MVGTPISQSSIYIISRLDSISKSGQYNLLEHGKPFWWKIKSFAICNYFYILYFHGSIIIKLIPRGGRNFDLVPWLRQNNAL